ncbi:MAG: hypothetical protein CMI54_05960 [Parcubacteria group bacterium]|nr:hypothetical protein [Parcubacteria group bacterium]|tara:strand:+ start:24932 stop:25126 length:195 start_codon:yes stop_codon:yes gene_type:complete
MNPNRIEALLKKAEKEGDNNLAIILHVYLGAKAVHQDGLFAEHCQDFARSGIEMIDLHKNRRNN